MADVVRVATDTTVLYREIERVAAPLGTQGTTTARAAYADGSGIGRATRLPALHP
jgi:hypothetical protein